MPIPTCVPGLLGAAPAPGSVSPTKSPRSAKGPPASHARGLHGASPTLTTHTCQPSIELKTPNSELSAGSRTKLHASHTSKGIVDFSIWIEYVTKIDLSTDR